MSVKTANKKKFYVPNTYTLIMIFIILAAIATYIVPAGEYTMVKDAATGKNAIDPTNFQFIERDPVGIGDFLLAIPKGMNGGAAVIFLTFLVGGFFQIINDTGAIDAAINISINKLQNRALLVIPIIMAMMSVLGALGIVVNATIAFIPIGIALAKKLKLDPMVGIAIMYLGAYSGFSSSPMGPFNTILGQTIAGLPLLSGFGLRCIVWAILFLVTTWYTYGYAKKLQEDPNNSVFDKITWESHEGKEDGEIAFKLGHALVLVALAIGFIVYAYGSYKLKWGLNYLSAMMLAVALVSGVVAKMHPDDMAKSFIKGAQSMVYGALVIGFAKSITIVLTDGHIIHSIIYYMTIPLTKVAPVFSAIGMFLANLIFNFVVPSGSGQAMIVMPLMSPMADVVGVTRQVAVSAYQYGDGFSNIIIPTSGVLMAVLGVAKVPYEKWLKFVGPLFLMWTGVGVVSIAVATLIGWS
ncbi:MAG: TIGR00366 family protein [Marinisporobacter sp.]|jgi:uncharacterized ion transporter superfamily protein YfcC|nr:TIGR00366 family protein [Marinisporobacter sp.]